MIEHCQTPASASSSRPLTARLLLSGAVGLMLIGLVGCNPMSAASTSGNDAAQLEHKVQTLEMENQDLLSKVARLQSENDQLKQQATAPTQIAAQPASPAPLSAVSGTDASQISDAAQPATTRTLSDVNDVEGVKDLNTLYQMGLIDATNGKFSPYQPISRAAYVRWLVSAKNEYYKDSDKDRIRLATPNDTATFVDVPASDPDFKYIQGLANAGYVVGVDATHFAPRQPLSREQMIGIKAQVDEGESISIRPENRGFTPFNDKDQIGDAYGNAVHEDFSVRTTGNIGRVWGNIMTFHPKQSVTRAEAAVSIVKVTDKSCLPAKS